MDVDSVAEEKYKQAEWLNREDSLENNSKFNRSTIFEHAYFWILFLTAASYIIDLLFYLIYYQEKFGIIYYEKATLILRIINDILFLFPLLIFIKFAITNNKLNYIIGGVVFLPQLVLNIISLVQIYNQDYCTDSNILCIIPKELEEEDIRRLNYNRITILRTTSLINLILYIFSIALTFLKIIRDY